MRVSVFQTFGIGRVASNKELGSKEIDVVPIELMNLHDGEMTSNPTIVEHKSKDIDGNETQGAIMTDQVLKATWLPQTDNRLTAPDVRRGERVEILTVGDSDKFYWRSMGLDGHLRKLETIVIAISNTTDESVTELTPENTYWFEFSTHSKRVAFSSSKTNGEPFKYEFFFDMENGIVSLNDDIGNIIEVISRLFQIRLVNTKGTEIMLDDKDLKMSAPQDLIANIVRDATIKAGRELLLAGGSSFLKMNSSETILKTPQFKGES